jgi:hypothetical protein
MQLLKKISLAASILAVGATFAHANPETRFQRKDANDAKTAEQMLAAVTKDIGDISTALTKSQADMEAKYREMVAQFGGVRDDSVETKAAVKKATDDYAELVKTTQSLTAALDDVKKELDAPLLKGGKDLEENDRKAAIELQRRSFLFKGNAEEDFKPDMNNLVKVADYRTAARKLAKAGIEDRAKIIRDFTADERKAFDAASLDSAFFMPEMLGIEVDCTVECAELIDLYDSVTVSRTNFMYPNVTSYGDIGSYTCDAKCDAELGDEGNIKWLNGKTYDFRGAFCFQRKTLQEANYDLLGFMFRAASKSHRYNRNRSLISGNGIDEPLGWLTANCFEKKDTPAGGFNHQDFRRFLAGLPVEYGAVTATMHQNVFAYLASAVDSNGRFIYGDGLMSFSPDDVRDRIRISNCLPDPTVGGTLGSETAPFVAGSFIAAAGAWKTAYASVAKKPMVMEQYVGGSSLWCVKYQFGAEDGGFVMCCAAAQTLVVGT